MGYVTVTISNNFMSIVFRASPGVNESIWSCNNNWSVFKVLVFIKVNWQNTPCFIFTIIHVPWSVNKPNQDGHENVSIATPLGTTGEILKSYILEWLNVVFFQVIFDRFTSQMSLERSLELISITTEALCM